MRISISTLGTRGDVQPYIALALGLMAAGHEVQLAAPVQFEAMVRERGIAFAGLPGEFLALLDTPEGKAAMASGEGFAAGFKLLKHIRPLMRRLMDDEWAAAQAFAPDAIVHHPKSLAAPHIAERLDCPAILASPLPGFTPTAAFPSPMLPFPSLGPLNRASHALVIGGANALFGKLVRSWRSEVLGLRGGSRRRPAVGTLYAYSPQVVPVPDDWGPDVLVSGYWFLDSEQWQPPDELRRFLAAGDPPVYVGFGSVPGLDPQAMTATIVEALARAGRRGLLATGGGALGGGQLPGHVHVIAAAPHDRLLPLVAATVQHGGAGTTAASLRAGVPTAICPFFGDQPFWGRRIAGLGVGPTPLDPRRLSVESLAAALTAMQEPAMRERARRLGAAIRAEDGAGAAVRFIEGRVAGHGSRGSAA